VRLKRRPHSFWAAPARPQPRRRRSLDANGARHLRQSEDFIMSSEGRRPAAILPDDRDRACDVARGHSNGAIAVLAAIMADDMAEPVVRVLAANSILAWSRAANAADPATGGKRDWTLSPVGVEWFGPPLPNR